MITDTIIDTVTRPTFYQKIYNIQAIHVISFLVNGRYPTDTQLNATSIIVVLKTNESNLNSVILKERQSGFLKHRVSS